MSNGPLWNRLVRVTAVLIAISALCFAGAESENAPPPPPLPIPAREFTTLQCIAIQDAISRLASRNFAERQAAQQLLVAAGGNGVPALTEAAQSEEREVAVRCVAILREVARDGPQAAAALEALKQIASNEDVPLAPQADGIYKELTQTAEDRAVALLTRAGVQLHDVSRGKVHLVRNLYRNSHLALLANLPDVRMIQATGPRVTDEGLESLSPLRTLFSVDLVQTSVTGEGLRHLQNHPRLMSLSLTADQLRVDDLRQLKHLPQLNTLTLKSLAHEGQLQFLDDAKQIGHLQLETVRLSREGVDVLNRQANLRRVGLTLFDAQDEQLREVSRLNTELTLTVRKCPDLTDAGWECLGGTGIRQLTILQSSITDAGVASIAKCENLEYLTIHEAPLSDAALEHLRALPRLKYAMLRETRISDEGLKRLKKARPTLQIR